MSSSLSTRYTTSNPYEALFGYSRAVRRGQHIFISGTTSIDPVTGETLHASGPDSGFGQARVAFAEAIRAVKSVGGSKTDIVRVRMFVTVPEDVESVGRALKDSLGDVAPAATMIIGAQFVRPELKVEVEMDAITE